MAAKDALGRRGEDLAAAYLTEQGLVVLDRNWRCRLGELDIVATDSARLVVCEVKTRSSTRYGLPAEAVDARKARRIRHIAGAWLAAHARPVGGGPLRRAGGARRARRTGPGAPLRGGVLMGLARTWSVALHGVAGHLVEIESDVGGGLPGIHLVGLPDAALHEAKDRVRAAVVNSGWPWPNERIVLALSPAMLRKAGSGFDFALACAVLAADGILPQPALNGTVLLGELALDGRLRPVRGVLPCLLAARAAGVARVVVPAAALAEASLVDGLEVYGAATLRRGAAVASGRAASCGGPEPPRCAGRATAAPPDLADVVGQDDARHACEIAAAGGHHLLLVGPPGTGKTMLAQRFVGLLPRLDAVRGAGAGVDPVRRRAAARLRGAHHRAAAGRAAPLHVAWPRSIGGGSGLPRPGAVSLAHRGRALPRRGSRVGAPPARCAAHPAGGGHGPAVAGRGHGRVPGAVPARARRQPVPVRARARPRLRVPVAGAPPLPGQAVRAAARPGRPAGADAADHHAGDGRGAQAESTATVRVG